MKPFSRAERVEGLLHKVLSDVIKKEIRDPRLEMITVTAVKMSGDLKHAKAYFTTSGSFEDRERAIEGFASAVGYLKKKIAQRLGLRYMPTLKFYYDETLDNSARIDQVLKSIQR